jgi:hypothetical protein
MKSLSADRALLTLRVMKASEFLVSISPGDGVGRSPTTADEHLFAQFPNFPNFFNQFPNFPNFNNFFRPPGPPGIPQYPSFPNFPNFSNFR